MNGEEESLFKAFAPMVDAVAGMPKPKRKPWEPESCPPGHVPCGRCGKWIPAEWVRYHQTGVCTASDSLCPECLSLVPNHALIVCCGCRAVVGRVAPEKFPDGFSYEPRKVYHIRDCPNCNCDAKSSRVIEAELFKKRKL